MLYLIVLELKLYNLSFALTVYLYGDNFIILLFNNITQQYTKSA